MDDDKRYPTFIPTAPPAADSATPLNTRQERFVQGLAQGLTLMEACRQAGYGQGRNGARILSLPNVAARLEALRGETASRVRLTIDDICARLMVIVDRMEESGGTVAELNLARRALMDMAKLLGTKGAGGPAREPITEIRRVIVCPDGQEWSYEELFGRPEPQRG
jgi:hypothetical protein